MTAPITRFDGPYRFLSNFFPVDVQCWGDLYPTVEHAFQASKTENPLERVMILKAPSPGKAKRLGRSVTLRGDWNQRRLQVMYNLVYQKFEFRPDLRDQLLATGEAVLIEGNTWGDTYWGACLKGGEWVGNNNLGRILMQVRRELQGETV